MTKSKRLYFTDPIKTLFMMKEFGVKFECKNSDEEMQEYDLNENERFFPFVDCGLDQPDLVQDLIGELNSFRKVYVKKESESIFEPKEGDLGINEQFYPCEYYLDGWHLADRLAEEKGYDIEGKVKIIMRNGKLFFNG